MLNAHHDALLSALSVGLPVFETVTHARPWAAFVWGQPTVDAPHGMMGSIAKAVSPAMAFGGLHEWLLDRSIREAMFPALGLPLAAALLVHLTDHSTADFYLASPFLQSAGLFRRPAHPEVPAFFDGSSAQFMVSTSTCVIFGRPLVAMTFNVLDGVA